MFYLQNDLTLQTGEEVRGSIECKRNAKNPRDLDICVEYRVDGAISKTSTVQQYRMR